MKKEGVAISISDSYPLTKKDLADLMLDSEPWATLDTNESDLAALVETLSSVGVLSVLMDQKLVGFAIVQSGFLSGHYLKILAVKKDYRSRGIGTLLMEEFEKRAFVIFPNTYLCVSSFNKRAREFYEQRGYRQVGKLEQFIVPEHDEILMRKTLGPRKFFKTKRAHTKK